MSAATSGATLTARRNAPTSGPRERRYTRERRMSPEPSDGVAPDPVSSSWVPRLGTPGFYARGAAASPRATVSQRTRRAVVAHRGRDDVEVRHRPAPAEQGERPRRSGRAAGPGRGPCRGSTRGRAARDPGRRSARARSPAPCVVGTAASAASPRSMRAGVAELRPGGVVGQVRRPGRAGRAVRVAELRRRRARQSDPCTTRRRRRASAGGRARAARPLRAAPAPPSGRRWDARVSGS